MSNVFQVIEKINKVESALLKDLDLILRELNEIHRVLAHLSGQIETQCRRIDTVILNSPSKDT